VGEQLRGLPVKCYKCGQPFLVNPDAPAGATVAASPTPPVPSAPEQPATAATATQAKSGGLWSKLRNVFGSAKSEAKTDDDEEVLPTIDVPGALAPEPKAAPRDLGEQSPEALENPGGAIRLDLGCATTMGRVRDRNEDSFLLQHLAWSNLDQRHELALAVVADGMGGHGGGDQASGQVVRTVGAALAPLLSGALSGQIKETPSKTLTETIDFAIKEANLAIHRKAQGDPALKGMGATVAAVLLWDGQALIGHVGDCRVYHYRAQKLTQVTRDQTIVARMVELGQLTPQEALVHPHRNEVSQAVGTRPELVPAFHEVKLAAGDWLIVACDGLHAHVNAATLQESIRASTAAATQLATQLVRLANEGGGSDNCTVLAVRCY
jgi:serine/threonine protein phosphatase PrpC